MGKVQNQTQLFITVHCAYLRGKSVLVCAGSEHGVVVGTRLNHANGWGVVRLVEKRGSIADFRTTKCAQRAGFSILYVSICCGCQIKVPKNQNGRCAKCGWLPGQKIEI